MTAVRTVRVIICGTVQGVGFRAWTKREAASLGLSGWVRNLSDGTVEAVLQGEDEPVKTMLHRCEQGPRMAAVIEVQRFEEKFDEALRQFSIV